jgi:MYXO-CTERM domain-containing protein
MARGQQTGVELLAKIRDGSRYRSRAALDLAGAYLLAKKVPEGIAEALAAARDPSLADDAVRLLLLAKRLHNAPVKDAIATIAKANGLAQLAQQRLQLEAQGAAIGNVSVGGFHAVAIVAGCGTGTFGETVTATKARVEKLQEFDDNAEAYDAVKRAKGELLLAVLLGDRHTRESIAWVESLNEQLVTFSRSDRAWQTTMVAAEILQEMTVQQSVAQADAGKLARQRIDELARDLGTLGAFAAAHGKPVPVLPSLCSSILGHKAPPVIAQPQPIPTTPAPATKAKGCAGCASGGTGGLALVAFGLIFAIRRRR